ncbi:carbohydrate-binding protein [Streptomyces sp. NPDC005386]|uniref:carbohydrate-binding protein n=1 Tax=Streptomyces sp. NPDC005386 TaxID=3154562 RepID=UPI0033A4AC21
MTPGNNGASTPEDDDPFGYLYADGQANGATPPSGGGGGYGYPGSVNRVRAVGERQYGQQQTAQGPYGQPNAPTAPYGQVPQQQGYNQPNAHYAAPETVPGGPVTTRSPMPGHGDGGGRAGGPNTRGLLIGAIAVVAAVVIGIGVAMLGGGGDDDKNDAAADPTSTASQSASPSQSASKAPGGAMDPKEIDAKALNLGTGVSTASDVKGAQSDGGVYVAGLNNPGSSVTWTVDGVPSDGVYTLFARYSVPGADQSMTLTVNGKTFGSKLSMKNYADAADGDFAKGWTKTYAWPSLNKGTNTITLSCGDGDSCNVLLDQFSLKKGQVKD